MGKDLIKNSCLSKARLIFWDFDGVIKESVDIKTEAFVRLFQSFGSETTDRIRRHHLVNGGMSRFEKIPLYMSWAGLHPTKEHVTNYCDRFGQLVFQSVVESPWVPGVEKYLRLNPLRQIFVLVSATPQAELEKILTSIDLTSCFTEVFGAPTSKSSAIRLMLSQRHIRSDECLMIGDSQTDIDAAAANQVPFLLRRHSSNQLIFQHYTGESVTDFKLL